MLNFLKKILFNKNQSNNKQVLSVYEQFSILNSQIENIYGLISSTNKFYITIVTSIVGAAVLLYANNVEPTEYFNYLYYIVLTIYTISVIWYRTLAMFLLDLNSNIEKYNNFLNENHIISMYNLSFPINVRKCSLILPFMTGTIMLIFLLRYSTFINFFDYALGFFYLAMFFFSFIFGFKKEILKYL